MRDTHHVGRDAPRDYVEDQWRPAAPTRSRQIAAFWASFAAGVVAGVVIHILIGG
jgi:uncharacterized membrane protein YoaK (UPF0700 family)